MLERGRVGRLDQQRQHALGERVAARVIELERLGVDEFRLRVQQYDAEPRAQQRTRRMAPEALEIGERDRLLGLGRQRRGEERARLRARALGEQARKRRARRVVREERAARREVFGRERLQRMLDHERAARGVDRVGRRVRAGRRGGQMVEQFVDERRGRQRRVVADAAARVCDQQALARGEQQIEEQIALVVAPLAVAELREHGHQVELVRAREARQHAVVHPDQAHDAIRQPAQARERRERDAAPRHAAARRIVERGREARAHDRGGQRRARRAFRHRGKHRVERVAHAGQRVGDRRPRIEEARERIGEHIAPTLRREVAGDAPRETVEVVGEAREAAEQLGFAALGARDRQPRRNGRRAIGHRVAEKEPRERVGERVARRGHGRVRRLGRIGREPAPRARCGQPGLHGFERRRVDPVARGDRVGAQPFDELRRADVALGQREPIEQHARDGIRLRRRQAGDPVRDARGVGARRRAEHRVDERPRRREIRHRDEHVRRREARVRVEPREQAIMQHLELPREAVAHVHFDAALGGRLAERGLRLQIEDRVLHAREPRRRGIVRVARRIARRRALGQLVQHVQLRLRLPAPFGEQRMADFLIVEPVRRVERLRARGRDDVEPEFAARIERVDAHVDPARQLAQQRDVQRRHRRQREHADRIRPLRPRARDHIGIEGAGLAQEPVRGRHAAVGQLREQRAPERGLPRLVVARGLAAVARRAFEREDRFAVLPLREPLRTIRQIVVEHRRDPVRKLVAHRRVGRGQIGGKPRRCAPRRGAVVRQQPVAAPHQAIGRERRMRGHRQHFADLRPQPLREIAEAHVRAHAVALREVELEPPAQRRARHDHLLRGPGARAVRREGEIVEQRVGQRFVAVRVEEMEHETG
ncbi:Uncharacterised protein [Burkholderia pseudomallei]|nr:Uncharacterised protein [Burkholderia pseudomallei]